MKVKLFLIAIVAVVLASCSASKKTATTNAITYTNDIKPIIDANCGTKCHNADRPADGIELTTYASVKEQSVNGKLIPSIQHAEGASPMPKKNPQLDEASIQKIVDWVAGGAPE